MFAFRRSCCVEVGRFGHGAGDGACFHPAGAGDGGFAHQDFLVLGDVGLAQERDFLVPDHERALGEVDAGLVALEHVEPEQQIHVLAFHDGEAAGEEQAADFDLGGVYPPEDIGGSDSAGDAGVALVDQAHDTAVFGAGR